MRFLIYAGLRGASRNQGRQQPKEWQPFTKLVVAFFAFGIPIALGGAARVTAVVILALIGALFAGCLVYGLSKAYEQRGKTAARRD